MSHTETMGGFSEIKWSSLSAYKAQITCYNAIAKMYNVLADNIVYAEACTKYDIYAYTTMALYEYKQISLSGPAEYIREHMGDEKANKVALAVSHLEDVVKHIGRFHKDVAYSYVEDAVGFLGEALSD